MDPWAWSCCVTRTAWTRVQYHTKGHPSPTALRLLVFISDKLDREKLGCTSCICHSAGPGKPSSVAPWPGCEPFHSRPDGARPPVPQRPRQLATVRSASASCRVLSRHLAHHSHCRPPSALPKTPAHRRQPLIYPNSSPDHRVCYFLSPLPVSSRRPSLSITVHRWIRAKEGAAGAVRLQLSIDRETVMNQYDDT